MTFQHMWGSADVVTIVNHSNPTTRIAGGVTPVDPQFDVDGVGVRVVCFHVYGPRKKVDALLQEWDASVIVFGGRGNRKGEVIYPFPQHLCFLPGFWFFLILVIKILSRLL